MALTVGLTRAMRSRCAETTSRADTFPGANPPRELSRRQLTDRQAPRSTPPRLNGTPQIARPISTPLSVPASMRSLKSPRCPMRKTRPLSLPRPVPSDMSKRSRMVWRSAIGVVSGCGITPRSATSLYSPALAREDLETPGLHRAARRFAVPRVAREHLRQPFLEQHAAAPRAVRRAGSSPACTERTRWRCRGASAAQSQYGLRQARRSSRPRAPWR